MSAQGSAETNIGQTGGSGGSGIVGWRDAYTTLGALDFSTPSTANATSGYVTVGDRIIGGNKASRQFGIVKFLAFFALTAVAYKIYKSSKR